MHFPLSGLVLFSIFGIVWGRTGAEVASYFRRHLSNASHVYLPSGNNYTLETTQRWNAFSAPTYIISVKPATDQDIQKIVRPLSPNKSAASQLCPHTKLIVEIDRICVSPQHIISRYRWWAWLLSNFWYDPERDRNRSWPFQHSLSRQKCKHNDSWRVCSLW